MTSASFTPAVESIDGVDVESAGGSVVHFCTLHLAGSRHEGDGRCRIATASGDYD